MLEYHRLLKRVLESGSYRKDRTGIGAFSVFGEQARFDLSKGFPLLTTKKVHLKSIIHELLWLVSGNTNIKYLQDNGVTIWDEWASPSGELGAVYGQQWRSWPDYRRPIGTLEDPSYATIDQLKGVIFSLQTNPYGRRHIVTAWNPSDVDHVKLPPCHCFFQFFVDDGKLSCQLYQRSADIFLGVPFNIASYALLTMMVAQVCNLGVGEFVHTFGDLHLYANHREQAVTQFSREPRPLPTMKINPDVRSIDGFKYEDFTLEGYDPHPAIKALVAV